MVILSEPVSIKTFFYLNRSDCCRNVQHGDIVRVGNHVVTSAADLSKNPACHETIEYLFDRTASGYYDCNLEGTIITIERPPYADPSTTPALSVMEFKAWSSYHLHHKLIPGRGWSSNGSRIWRNRHWMTGNRRMGIWEPDVKRKRPVNLNMRLWPKVRSGFWGDFSVKTPTFNGWIMMELD